MKALPATGEASRDGMRFVRPRSKRRSYIDQRAPDSYKKYPSNRELLQGQLFGQENSNCMAHDWFMGTADNDDGMMQALAQEEETDVLSDEGDQSARKRKETQDAKVRDTNPVSFPNGFAQPVIATPFQATWRSDQHQAHLRAPVCDSR